MNKSMLIDLYQLTMSNVYKTKNKEKVAYFESFYRKNAIGGYSIMAGVDEVIDYILNFKFTEDDIEYLKSINKVSNELVDYLKNFKFTGDIYMVPDGTPIFPNEPILTVKANLIEAQILETAILNILNGHLKFSTASRHIVESAKGIPIMEFGARRSDSKDAALSASKCAYMTGCVGTSNLEAGKKYNIPVMGTMAHSFIAVFDNEYEAFKAYAQINENPVFLVDTFDTLNSGVPNAIKVANELGCIPNIRIDSGDLAYLSIEARKMLDIAGYKEAKICISNGLDSKIIQSILKEGAPIDSMGVGDNITSALINPGCVYKLVAIEENKKIIPKIKLSDELAKVINPGYKKVYRFYDKNSGYALGDVITFNDEIISEESYKLIDPLNEFNQKIISNYDVRELQVPIFINGKLVYEELSLEEKRIYCNNEMKTIYPEIKRLENPHGYYVDLSELLLETKKVMVKKMKGLD